MEISAERDSMDKSTLETSQRRRPPALNLLRHTSSFNGPLSPTAHENHTQAPLRSPGQLTRSNTLPRSYPKSPLKESPGPSVFQESHPLRVNSEVAARLASWIVCLALVNFDLDLGPKILDVFPPQDFSLSEKENISFSSFPDSAQFNEGSSIHSFRFRWSSSQVHDSGHSPDGFLYGFSYFSRRKDKASVRGYDQRSLTFLTIHPWPSFFTDVLTTLGPLYLKHGTPMLESACHNIASWPSPTPGNTYELGFLGTVLHVEIPSSVEQFQSTDTTSFGEKYSVNSHILASMAPPIPSPLNEFAASVTHLWSLWECLVLCEPVIVFGTSSASTSQAIWWLWDVLRPIPTAIDFRPYFTIHDKDYAAIIQKKVPSAGLVLGVTNPLFKNLCGHWPHRLSLGRKYDPQSPGWTTKNHNRYISKDRDLLSRLENAVNVDGLIDADGRLALTLRRHFTTRMVQFLVPLNRYLNTLIPDNKSSSGATKARSLKPFNQAHFMASLKEHGSPLPFRSTTKKKEFYERWLRSPSFGFWLAKQDETISAFLRKADEGKR